MITLPWFPPLLYTLLILSLLYFLSAVGPLFFGAPWVPMPVAVARRMLQLAKVQPGETVYDLGSGDGRVLIVAAREFGASGVGVEIEPLRACLSLFTVYLLGLYPHARVLRANFYDVDLRDADVVTLYLLPKAAARLAPKLQRELKPGARVATLTYHLLDWAPTTQDGDIHIYRVGL